MRFHLFAADCFFRTPGAQQLQPEKKHIAQSQSPRSAIFNFDYSFQL